METSTKLGPSLWALNEATRFMTKYADTDNIERLANLLDETGEKKRLMAMESALRKIISEWKPYHSAAMERHENSGTEALQDPAYAEACALQDVIEIAEIALES